MLVTRVRQVQNCARDEEQGARSTAAKWSVIQTIKMPAKKKLERRQSSKVRMVVPGEGTIYEMQVRICNALANPTRMRILDLLGH